MLRHTAEAEDIIPTATATEYAITAEIITAEVTEDITLTRTATAYAIITEAVCTTAAAVTEDAADKINRR